MPRFRADVGVRGGRIATIGRIRESAQRDDRRRGPGRYAGVRGRSHAHGRADLLGPARHVFLLPRHHHGRDGQLRLHARAVRGEGQAPGRAQPAARRGHSARGDGGRHQVELDDLSRVPGDDRSAAQGHQLRGLRRTFRDPHVRDGRARVRRARDRGRSQGDGAPRARRDSRRRHGLHVLALAEPRDAGRPPGGEPQGRRGARCAGWWARWAS